jgi:alanyl-tRNA synthetase
MILANESLSIVFKSLEEARRDGAMALFGEKYGETVRTISIHAPGDHKQRWSYELCGGTHVRSTAEIGSFVITREESSSAGVRRIEAVTGRGAWALIHDRLVTLETIAELLGADVESASARAQTLIAEFREAQHRLEQFRREAALMTVDTLVQEAVEVAGSQVIAAQVDASDTDLLSQMADWCRDRLDSGVVLLGSAIEGKVRLVAKVTPDLVKRGVHAGQLVGSIAKQVGGGGGGRPDFATAGGKDVARLPDAVRSTIKMVEDALK